VTDQEAVEQFALLVYLAVTRRQRHVYALDQARI